MITDFDLLLTETEAAFQVGREEILGPTRKKTPALARHVVMALWADDHAFQDAANRCNRGCHSTAMWARERVLSMAELDPSFASMINAIYHKCQWRAEEPEAIEPEKETEIS
jgi:chromosomal replication initiation ATPase DnaA